MSVTKLKVVLYAGGKSVIGSPNEKPQFSGGGNFTGACGSCGHILLKDIDQSSIRGCIFQCWKCNALNDFPSASN